MSRWGVLITIYAAMSLAAGAGAHFVHGSILTHPSPWLELEPFTAHAYSSLMGLTLGLLTVQLTRWLVGRTSFGRTLHEELKSLARGATPGVVLWASLLSALGEELFFRALLAPLLGLFGQAALFGLAHQLPGRARWIWVIWASIMGLVFGVLYQLTGSLVGPIVAHATINGLNLRFLRHHDATVTPRPLGGVLGQRT